MTASLPDVSVKVPAATLGFWVIKILATTLGETGADLFTQQYDFGYLAGIGLFVLPLGVLILFQIRARHFHPLLYWATILASTTAGTALADYFDRSIGLGYAGGASILAISVAGVLLLWKATLGTVAIESVKVPSSEAFYWLTITLSQTLGTALGDWAADEGGMGYLGGAIVFGSLLATLWGLYRFTSLSRVLLFWSAFILTRPLGATLGDFLDKPLAHGGLGMGRDVASGLLMIALGVALFLIPKRSGDAQKG
jgi:uncharacterized membrane-anchored protein